MLNSLIDKVAALGERIVRERMDREQQQLTFCEDVMRRAHQQRECIEKKRTDPLAYFDLAQLAAWRTAVAELDDLHQNKNVSRRIVKQFRPQINELKQYGETLSKVREQHNRKLIADRKTQHKALFSSIEGHALDDQQIDCIVREDDNILVVAGAGSGKTTTIVGKVKYLIQTGQCLPNEMLVLSFTNASAAEMGNLLQIETKQDFDAMTFHKLGLSIIAEVEGKKPSVSSINMVDFVGETISSLMGDSVYFALLVRFITSFIKEYRSQFEYKSEAEYLEQNERQLITLRGERVKSLEEVEIADFLCLNGIAYSYERPYEVDTATEERAQYRPDFYLPDYHIYIEHFGINRNGDVPPFFSGEKGKTPRQTYHEGMDWKRKTHKENGTTLIESYSYEKAEGKLTTNLRDKLVVKGVQLKSVNREEFLSILKKHGRIGELQGLQELIATFINLAKANAFSGDDLHQRNKTFGGFAFLKNEAFLQLVMPIFERYNEALANNNEVDFNDMINKAAKYVLAGRYPRVYKQIIIDEYQDISMSRYNLVKALRDRNQARLFCVGDDWQSIYRFAGSDTSLFTDFDKYWGPTERCLIETTYRFGGGIIDPSGQFVMKNPRQIKRNLRSVKGTGSSVRILSCSSDRYAGVDLKNALDGLPFGAQVLLLGRYTRDIQSFLGDDMTTRYDQRRGKTMITYTKRRDLDIDYLTVHRSKGLQASHVFILNNKNERLGFPSNIQDSSVLSHGIREQRRLPFR